MIDYIILKIKLSMKSKCFFFVGKHVMRNGAIYMEIVTNHGWNEVFTIETVIMQAAASLAIGNTHIPPQDKVCIKIIFD